MAPGKVGLCRDGDARGSCKGKGRLAEWLGSSTRPQAPSLAPRKWRGKWGGVSKQRHQGFRDSLGYIDILDQPGRHRPRRNALGQHHQLHEAKMETEASGGCPLLSLYCN